MPRTATKAYATRPDGRLRASVKSCERTLDILELFLRTEQPARTSEVSGALDLPNSSTDEILRTLARRGFLSFNHSSKRYAPSYKLVAMGASVERAFFGDGRVRALMDELRERTGANVCLAALNDFWMEDVGQLRSDGHRQDRPARYDPMVMHHGARGWAPSTNFAGALLALQTNREIVEIMRRMQSMGAASEEPAPLKQLIDRVGRIRARGFSLRLRDEGAPVDSVAYPLRAAKSGVPLAIGVWGERLFPAGRAKTALVEDMQQIVLHHA